jgi:hypothetical protein
MWHGNATILSPRAKRRHLHSKECRKSRTTLTRNISLRPLTMAEANSLEVGLYLVFQHFHSEKVADKKDYILPAKTKIYISMPHPKMLKHTKIF